MKRCILAIYNTKHHYILPRHNVIHVILLITNGTIIFRLGAGAGGWLYTLHYITDHAALKKKTTHLSWEKFRTEIWLAAKNSGNLLILWKLGELLRSELPHQPILLSIRSLTATVAYGLRKQTTLFVFQPPTTWEQQPPTTRSVYHQTYPGRLQVTNRCGCLAGRGGGYFVS